ncbi:MAG: hypothetical protein ABR915_20650 [Thermoguttaceae bacterium]
MNMRPACFAVVLCLAVGGAISWALAAEPPAAPGRAGPIRDAIKLQQDLKKRYVLLMQIMADVSRRLEATDPKTAAAISAAAQRAEAALIANDMDKVVALLETGLVVPADVTQGKVVMRLREVLKALRGEDGLEWRLFMLQEIQQQLADLGVIIERQQALERQSRMLAFGDRMRGEIRDVRKDVDAAVRRQEDVLEQTRRLAPSPAAMEFAGIRQGIAGLLRRFNTAKDSLWNPTPAPDQVAQNVVAVRRYLAETATLRSDARALLGREVVRRALETSPPERRGERMVECVGRAVEELDSSAKAMAANDVKEALVALSEAKAQLQDALVRLDETLEGLSGVRPAVGIAAEQKKLDDAVTRLEPAMRKLFPAGLAAIDDSPSGGQRVTEDSVRLVARPTEWAGRSPVLLALDPTGTAARQEQSLEKVQDWSARLEEALREIDRLHEEPRYPVQKKDQEGIGEDLRSILDANRGRAETVENDAELSNFFSLLRVAMENAADYSNKAAEELGKERPAEANPPQNEVIQLLTAVRDRIGPELKMDKNKYAMNEQMLARVQQMIMKQKMFCAQSRAVWEKRPASGQFGRTEQLRIEALAKDQAGLEEDFKYGWEIVNTAHNVAYALFPPEARVLWELARSESRTAATRLSGLDPGPETRSIQDSILERLQAIAKLLGPGFGEEVKELDRKFTYDSFLSRMSLHNTRVNEIGLLVTLQEDINRRTAEIDKARRSGKVDASVEQEAEQLRQLQEHVRQGLETWARMDARSWMGIDYMPTQYGTNRGGAKQGPVAPSLKD